MPIRAPRACIGGVAASAPESGPPILQPDEDATRRSVTPLVFDPDALRACTRLQPQARDEDPGHPRTDRSNPAAEGPFWFARWGHLQPSRCRLPTVCRKGLPDSAQGQGSIPPDRTVLATLQRLLTREAMDPFGFYTAWTHCCLSRPEKRTFATLPHRCQVSDTTRRWCSRAN